MVRDFVTKNRAKSSINPVNAIFRDEDFMKNDSVRAGCGGSGSEVEFSIIGFCLR